MSDCRDLEPLMACYVDGEAEPGACATVDAHLASCPPCREHVQAQRAARDVLAARRASLRPCPSDGLRHRCRAQLDAARPSPKSPARPSLIARPLVQLALAASILFALVFSGVLWLNPGVELFAAQIAADHVKCHLFADAGAHPDPQLLASDWQRDQGWALAVPASAAAYGLQLVGMRRCGSTEGPNAHILYRWRGEPLSLYVMNAVAEHTSPRVQTIEKLGQDAVIWSEHGRTYVVVADADLRELEPIVKYVKLNVNKW